MKIVRTSRMIPTNLDFPSHPYGLIEESLIDALIHALFC
jgi:hypothetical protein